MLNRAVFRASLEYWDDTDQLNRQIDELMRHEKLVVQRKTKDKVKEIDIRPAIYGLSVLDDHLEMELGLGEAGFVRPGEVIELLSEGRNVDTPVVIIHRTELSRIDEQGVRLSAMEL
jgi:hypothetical protein